MIYVINARVEIAADDASEADAVLRAALDGARMADIVCVSTEVVQVQEED